MAVVLMVNSHRITRHKQLIPRYRSAMEPYLGSIWTKFFEIFNENSVK